MTELTETLQRLIALASARDVTFSIDVDPGDTLSMYSVSARNKDGTADLMLSISRLPDGLAILERFTEIQPRVIEKEDTDQ